MFLSVQEARGNWIARYDDGVNGHSVVSSNPIKAFLVLLCVLEDEGLFDPEEVYGHD